MRPVVLLTDFGLADLYVGVLHAVLEREATGVTRIDLGHQVPPGDVWQACYLVRCAWPHLPAEAVVLAVVDPGVGTERLPVAARIGERFVVAPDNGLAAAVGPADQAVALEPLRMGLPAPSTTFHGRDLFAPAAARLGLGDDLDALGRAIDPATLIPCPLPEPQPTAEGWEATVLHCDRFGNLITNLPAGWIRDSAVLRWRGGRAARLVGTFAEGAAGEVVALSGSSGLLELVVNRGSAADRAGLVRGDTVQVAEGADG